ncbi:hypothetical protein ACJIZ3_024853 [Penstemon smallii]|uniref:Helitron helicase-like domain-containing protein n=1 Tax=Penstemon smallii TaxID=265156 RepID=A0ABD3TVM3_9LAMI
MDRRLSLEDLKNERRRQRHAVLSTEERRSRRARCRDTDVPSTASVNVGASFVSVSLGSALEVGQIPGATFEFGESSTASVGLLNARDDLQTCSSISLGPNFEIGEASSASVGQQHGVPVVPSPLPLARHRRQPVGRFGRISAVPIVPWVLPSSPPCLHCGAFRFLRETPGFCCSNGQVCLPPPKVCPILRSLFTDMSEIACDFRQRDRTYNNAFAFTSIGMSTDGDSWLAKDGIYALKVFGQVFHFINPIDGSPNTKDLLQLFFLQSAAELDSELLAVKGLRNDVMSLIVEALSKNPYSVFFKRLRSWDDLKDAHVVLRSNTCLDQRTHNLPTVDEVAAVWRDSDEGDASQRRDIRVYTDGTRGHTIKYYYSCYDTLQYPLLFPNGEPGWHAGIKKIDTVLRSCGRKRKDPCVSFAAADPTNMASAEEILEREEQGT